MYKVDAPVCLYVMGANVWRNEQECPLARTIYASFYLDSRGFAGASETDGKLVVSPSVLSQQPDRYTYDPTDPVPTSGGAILGFNAGVKKQNAIEYRQDVLVYSTDVLLEDLEITGPVKAILFVKTPAQNTDFTAKLVDVHPDGIAYNISDGILRRSYNFSADVSDPPIQIEIDLWPISMVFKKGHKLRLEISSSNYPRFDRNPNTGGEIATEIRPVTANQLLFHGKLWPSRIILPIISSPNQALN